MFRWETRSSQDCLNITLIAPQLTPQTYEDTLVDRLGFAARQNGSGTGSISVDPSACAYYLRSRHLHGQDVLPGLQGPQTAQLLLNRVAQEQQLLTQYAAENNSVSADDTAMRLAFIAYEQAALQDCSRSIPKPRPRT